jgi:RIO kinase 1
MLRTLSAAGADVPAPVAMSGDGILMTYVGDVDQAAPQLHRHRPERDEAQELFDQLIKNVERMLYVNVIHADLSPFNVLVWEGRATVIDLPQAVDPRKNRHARRLLERDVERICEHFARFGVRSNPHGVAHDLWTAWTFADLVPEELRGLI